MKKIKIAIAEDQHLFREGIISLLKEEKNIRVILEAENGKKLIEGLTKLEEDQLPDVIFMDIRMPVMDGLETSAYVLKHYSKIKIVALTMFNTEEYILKMHRIGVHGFLTKDLLVDDLLDALDTVLHKGSYYSPEVTELLLKSATKKGSLKRIASENQLSERELEIIRLICEEQSNHEIADALSISVRTVEWHRKNIFDKLQVKTSIGLMKYAMDNNLL